MLLWIGVLILLLLNIYYDDPIKKKKLFFFICILLILIVGLRSLNVGSDTTAYRTVYMNANRLSQQGLFNRYPSMERPFLMLNVFFVKLGIPYHVLLLLMASISLGGVFYYIAKLSKDRYLTLFLYFASGAFFLTMTSLRQCLAIGIIMIGIVQLRENKYLKFILLVGVASLFHTSALLMLILLPLSKLKFRIGYFIVGLAGSVFIALFLGSFAFLLPDKYAYYLADEVRISLGSIIQISFFIFQLIAIILIIKKFIKNKTLTDYSLLLYTFSFQCFFELISLRIDLVSRVTMYFVPINVLLWGNIIHDIEDVKKQKLLKITVCSIYTVYCLVWLYLNAFMKYYPYTMLV